MHEKSAFILSLAVHFLIFEFIILTFSLRPVAHKPVFVFLGSILAQEETTALAIEAKGATNHISSIKTHIDTKSSFPPVEESSMIKPKYSGIIPKEIKHNLKSTFLEDANLESQNTMLLHLGISAEPPRYTPLRIDTP